MKAVLAAIDARKASFEKGALFQLLEGSATTADVATLAREVTLFPLVFQDVLRLNEGRIRDPRLKRLAQTHRREDGGHERWFLSDMKRLSVEPDLEWAFGRHHEATRDACYAVAAEVFRDLDDALRLVILLVLESTGDAFFSRAHGFIESAGLGADLKYLSRLHWNVEQAHDIFGNSASDLEAMELSDPVRRDALALVDRMFGTMEHMVDHVHGRIQANRAA